MTLITRYGNLAVRRKLQVKQCKRGRSLAKLLQRLGASGEGWWRLSLTHPVHQAMPQEWFAPQGLVSLIDKYGALRH
jgi:hypothetical protein